jgi:hypothetical protein
MHKENEWFACLRQTFPTISEAELKEGVFFDRQITKYQDFGIKLNSTERRAWNAFENACRNFFRQ